MANISSALPKIKLAEGLSICPILNGMWQIAGFKEKQLEAAMKNMFDLVDSGYTTFDGADHYGPAEEWMGELRTRFTTKYGKKPSTDDLQFFTKWCPSPNEMTDAVVNKNIDRSLQRMKTNCLDLVQFHWWDYQDKEYITALKIMTKLQQQGKIKHLALTNFNTEVLREIVVQNGIKIVSNQVSYSIIDRRPEYGMVQFCLQHDMKLLTYGTLLGGFLSENWIGQPEPNYNSLSTVSLRKYFQFISKFGGWQIFQGVLKAVKEVANKHNVSVANVAIKYILDKPAVGGVIIGVRLGVSEHIQDNKRTFDLKLDPEDIEKIQTAVKKGNPLPADCGDEYRGLW